MEIEYIKDTFDEYLAKKDFISASCIKNFLKSPKYYYYNKFLKPKTDRERFFAIGSAIHEMILEPEMFFTNFAVCPKLDKRTKVGREYYEKFEQDNKGKTVIEDSEMTVVVAVAESSRKNKTLTDLIVNSYYELSCYTEDEATGLKLKMRPDSMCKTKSTIIDIKSCLDSSAKEFKKSVYKYNYSISAAFYSDFLKRENYVFAAVEKEAPYQVSLYTLNDEMIEYGREQYRMGLDLLKWSIDNNYWADYNEFEILKECYQLGNLDNFFDLKDNSELITIL
jgi:exodeoxyribonuclease VIII